MVWKVSFVFYIILMLQWEDSQPPFWGICLQSGTWLSLGITEVAPSVWLLGLPPLGVLTLGSFQMRLSWKDLWGPTVLPPGDAKLFSADWSYSCGSATWGLPGCREYSPQRLLCEMNALWPILVFWFCLTPWIASCFWRGGRISWLICLCSRGGDKGDQLLLWCGRGSNQSSWHVLWSRRCNT